MHKILIELILTNNCNKRCNYCDLNFKDKSLSKKDLDIFTGFIKNNKADYSINFFGWEPLLKYNNLKYFLDNSKKYINNFSIWTNWILLDKEKLNYFKLNNVNVYLSVDNIKIWKDLNFKLLSKYKDIININFINDPSFLSNSIITFEKIKNFWFKNIAFMPVFWTKEWKKKNLKDLKDIYIKIKDNSIWIKLETYTYFNWVSIDKQFILDTDLFFYSDLDSLLWLQKQYKNIDIKLKKDINKKTKLLSLSDKTLNLNNLLSLYNIDDILKLVFKIPNKSWEALSYKIIDKILKNET